MLKRCHGCGRIIEHGHLNKIYCSPSCRNNFYAYIHRDERRELRCPENIAANKAYYRMTEEEKADYLEHIRQEVMKK